MNKLKSINIIALALQVFSAILLFQNDVFNLRWGDPSSFFGRDDTTVSFYSKFRVVTEGKFLGTIFFLFLAITIIALILQIVSKKSYKITLAGAVVQLILFLSYNAIFEETTTSYDYVYTYSPGAFYYLIVLIFIILIVLSFVTIIMSKRIKEEPQEITSIPITTEKSNADELKKYKELLDSGIITQEEFDLKKKQLLGL